MTVVMSQQTLIERFRGARSDQSLAVLEGFHPLKHAIRFGADLIETVSPNIEELRNIADGYAPDIAERMTKDVMEVSEEVFQQLTPMPPPTGVIAIAWRPTVSLTELLGSVAPSPIVLLENPRNLLNIGASVRVSAAAGAAGVVTTGAQDPWHPAALIAGTGLQFALPVTRAAVLPSCDRPLVVIDPGGQPLPETDIPARAILAFGSERDGLSRDLMTLADLRVSIPMRQGVSSLNLATAVAVVVYAWELGK